MEGECLITPGKLFQTLGPWNCKVFRRLLVVVCKSEQNFDLIY